MNNNNSALEKVRALMDRTMRGQGGIAAIVNMTNDIFQCAIDGEEEPFQIREARLVLSFDNGTTKHFSYDHDSVPVTSTNGFLFAARKKRIGLEALIPVGEDKDSIACLFCEANQFSNQEGLIKVGLVIDRTDVTIIALMDMQNKIASCHAIWNDADSQSEFLQIIDMFCQKLSTEKANWYEL